LSRQGVCRYYGERSETKNEGQKPRLRHKDLSYAKYR
jgi:hypothetical protein